MFTEAQIRDALNNAADLVCDEAGLSDEGARDAINLVVNVVGHWLFVNPDANLTEVIEASYENSVDEVLGWCGQ